MDSFSLTPDWLLDEFGMIQVDEKVLENVLDRSIVDVAVGLELADYKLPKVKLPEVEQAKMIKFQIKSYPCPRRAPC